MIGNNSEEKAKCYVVIHGHFYQPPRENPWLDMIEEQPSAAPSHDWNERIYDQCYRPNAYSRLLDSNGMINNVHNNYTMMSYNFGPTLYRWLEKKHPATAKRIVEADEQSRRLFDGHGNAVAQVYNHIIMPLSSRRDQLTQIRWTKYFFRKRFGRDPEGIWLAETAINMETVQCLIEEKIRFVVLAPGQAEAFRPLSGNGDLIPTSSQGIDTRRAYRIFPKNQAGKRLPGYLDTFFFDEGISKEISFGNLLTDAHIIGDRIKGCYDQDASSDQLVVVATDGETFGHHKPFGDMCLAYFFTHVAPKYGIIPVNFGYFLSVNPPTHEATLKNAFNEGTAWSCAHGVGRWIRDCGCKTGGPDHWRQTWRTPLRKALETLQEHVDSIYETKFVKISPDPWKIRDRYISVMESGSYKQVKKFLESNTSSGVLDKADVLGYRKLLEAQKYMLFSFTSCAWFFSDISGLEAMQNLAYACRALQLGIPQEEQAEVFTEFLSILEGAVSNNEGNGKTLFDKEILPFMEHLRLIAFTAAAKKSLGVKKSTSFDEFDFAVELKELLNETHGQIIYQAYSLTLENEISGETGHYGVLVAHHQGSDIHGWVVPHANLHKEKKNFAPDDFIGNKQARMFTLNDIFRTSRQMMASYFLGQIEKDTDTRFSAWAKKNERVLDSMSRIGFPLPHYCAEPLSFVFTEEWNRLISKLEKNGEEDNVFTQLLSLRKSSEQFNVEIQFTKTTQILELLLVKEFEKLSVSLDADTCDRIRFLLNIVDRFAIPVSKHKLEDIFHPILNGSVVALYNEVISKLATKVPDVSKREVLIRLVSFARRMNFNTDRFQIS